MVPQELTKSDIVKIIEQLDKLLPSNFVNKQGRNKTEVEKSLFWQEHFEAMRYPILWGKDNKRLGIRKKGTYEFECKKPIDSRLDDNNSCCT